MDINDVEKYLSTFMSKTRTAFILLALVLFAAIVAGCTSSSTAAKNGDNVTIDYTINSTGGKVYQTSYAQMAKDLGFYDPSGSYVPYHFKVGGGTAIAGIDEAVAGMKVNETKTVTVPPEKSYGSYNQSQVIPFNLSEVAAGNVTLNVNDSLEMSISQNGMIITRNVRVASIDAANDTVYIDFNRPHAGETLVITITLRNIE